MREAVPLIVPSNQSEANAEAVVARLDAILLTGSNSNIVPGRYGSDAEAGSRAMTARRLRVGPRSRRDRCR